MCVVVVMKLDVLISKLLRTYTGLAAVKAWGETGLFYNPYKVLERGSYCITFKEADGNNDNSSQLNREVVNFRMNFKITKSSFLRHFQEPSLPSRPAKGQIITLKSGKAYNPTVLNELIPHPVYGWMSWVSIINPSDDAIELLLQSGLLQESYQDAVSRHDRHKTVIAYLANCCNNSNNNNAEDEGEKKQVKKRAATTANSKDSNKRTKVKSSNTK